MAHVRLGDDELDKERYQQSQHIVLEVIVPRLDPNAVQRRRRLEVLGEVVYYDGSRQVAPQIVQVLDGVVKVRRRVLPVQAVSNGATIAIQVVKDPVSVLEKQKSQKHEDDKKVTYVWHGCREDDYFEVLRKLGQEPVAPGPDQVVAGILDGRVHIVVYLEVH